MQKAMLNLSEQTKWQVGGSYQKRFPETKSEEEGVKKRAGRGFPKKSTVPCREESNTKEIY